MKAIAPAIVLLAVASAASAQTPAGGDFQVNAYTTGIQFLARPSMEPDGDFVAAWTSYDQDGSDRGIFGRRFASTGVPRGGEFQVNTYTTNLQNVPIVAVGSRGDFVAVWHSFQDGSGGSVHGQRYDPSGDRIGSEFQINTFTLGYQYSPRVARAFDGRFVVVWTSASGDGSQSGVVGRRYDPWGNAIGGEFAVNTYTTGQQQWPDIGVNADGSFVVVWEDGNARDGDGRAVFGQRFNALGARVGSEFQVNSYTTGQQKYVSLSASPAGGFVVVWSSPDGSGEGVSARRLDASGSPIGSDFMVNTYTTGNQYETWGKGVAHDGRGNFVITWRGPGDGSYSGIFAQRFSASGARRGGEFITNSFTPGYQELPSVASDAVGNFVVIWDGVSPVDMDNGILARRFGGLRPAALRADTSGNGILEPGEVGDVRPAWRNENGAAQTFTATIGSAGGPTGGVPQILDSVGVYGTVANGTSSECTTCYNVLIPSPSPRPATHWDGTVVESIVPDSQGQQKQWLLHVGRSFTDVPVVEPVLSLHRDDPAPERHRRLLHHRVLPDQHPRRASRWRLFVLAGEGGIGIRATVVHDSDVQRRPAHQRLLPLDRGAGAPGRGDRLRRRQLLPVPRVTREQMSVFVLRTLDAALTPPPCVPTKHLQRRAGDQPFLPLDRGADAARRSHRLRRRQLLSGRRRDPRADGRLHQRDLRPDAVRPLRDQ